MNKKAFSLIELIVGISISMILMVSVGVFVSNGMQNILAQQKVLENTDNFNDFSDNLNTTFNLIQSGSFIPVTTSSGILFKRAQNFGEGGFTYIGTSILDKEYCLSGSEDTKTNSIYIKNFIPFEENNSENIFTNYDDILTGKSGIYTSFQKEHVIKDNSGNIIVGKGIFGHKFTEGASGTGIYLNSPTGLAQNGGNLYISDTLNNRILYLDSSNKIHLLLDEYDGLNEPTGLFFFNNELYIANSGNGEILKYSSKSETEGILTLTGITENNINKIEIDFYKQDGTIQNISGPTESDISTPGSSNDFSEIIGNKITYYFVNYTGLDTTINDCIGNSGKEVLSGGNPVNCTASGTGQLSNSVNINFNNSTITVNNIDNLSNTGSYYIDLKLNSTHKNYFPYFIKSDDNLTTKNDNILTVVQSGLKYPTGIWGISNYNQFGTHAFNNKTLAYNDNDTDILLGTPIKSLSITNSPNDLISLSLKYYKRYNCYNLDNNAERTYLLKKNLK